MINTISIIDKLNSVTKRSDKEQIIFDAFMRGNREFFIGAQLCYDSMHTFGLKKVAEIIEEDDISGSFLFSDFLILAKNIQKRKLVGEAVRAAINDAAEICQAEIWNKFYRRILLHDLGCVDRSIINKVLKKLSPTENEAKLYIIPSFGCQLAKEGTILIGKKLIDIRLTGTRILSFLDKEVGTVTLYNKKGLNVDVLYPEIKKKLESLLEDLPGSLVFDGQIVDKSFTELMTSSTDSSIKLALFDIIPMNEYKRGGTNITQENRHTVLASLEITGILQKHAGDTIYVLPKISIDFETMQGKEKFEDFYNNIKHLIDKKLSKGIMVKDPNAPYMLQRSMNWMKLKNGPK